MTFDVKKLTRTSLLLALAIVFQAIGRSYPIASQFLVGPIINTIFILCLFLNGLSWSILVAMLTPLLAWSLGQLPAPLGPIIPIIILGNISFILVFHVGRKLLKGTSALLDLPSILFASLAKFGIIYFGVKLALEFINLAPQAAKAATKLMGINQLITALAGGILALVISKVIEGRVRGSISGS